MNKALFQSPRTYDLPAVTNAAGGPAVALQHREVLAHVATTANFREGFYQGANAQLDMLLEAANHCGPMYVAQAAAYARREAHQKDAPAVLMAHLASKAATDPVAACTFELAFPLVIDNGKMLGNFLAALRSKRTGRHGLGSMVKDKVANWILNREPEQLLRDSIGGTVTLRDAIRLSHPKPRGDNQSSFFRWVLGKGEGEGVEVLERLKRFRESRNPADMDGLPLEMVTSEKLTSAHWAKLAETMGWQALRMNLNTIARHKAYTPEVTRIVALRLRNIIEAHKARALPHQLLMAYQYLDPEVPSEVRNAVTLALEESLQRVPTLNRPVAIAVDTSGSMRSPITGSSNGQTSKATCVEVASLIACALARANPDALILPFDTMVHPVKLNPFDTVATNTAILSRFGGGGTACAEPFRVLNAGQWPANKVAPLVVLISDMESWVGARVPGSWYGNPASTGVEHEFEVLKRRAPGAKLACINIQPSGTTQAVGTDILNIAGFSDAVWPALRDFANGDNTAASLVKRISEYPLAQK